MVFIMKNYKLKKIDALFGNAGLLINGYFPTPRLVIQALQEGVIDLNGNEYLFFSICISLSPGAKFSSKTFPFQETTRKRIIRRLVKKGYLAKDTQKRFSEFGYITESKYDFSPMYKVIIDHYKIPGDWTDSDEYIKKTSNNNFVDKIIGKIHKTWAGEFERDFRHKSIPAKKLVELVGKRKGYESEDYKKVKEINDDYFNKNMNQLVTTLAKEKAMIEELEKVNTELIDLEPENSIKEPLTTSSETADFDEFIKSMV
jgi:hypothetical protein